MAAEAAFGAPRSLRPDDERDAREVDGGRGVREELSERPSNQSRRPDRIRVRRRPENEGDHELVGADRVGAVPVVPIAEVTGKPVVDDRAKPLQSMQHLPGRVTALAAQRDACAVPRP